MATITVTDKNYNQNNLLYVQTGLSELFKSADCSVKFKEFNERNLLSVSCPDHYADIVKTEIADRVAEIVAVSYKYEFFKNNIRVAGLTKKENEILMASLIAADLTEDKRYTFERFKNLNDLSIDGTFNFRLKPLRKKWEDIVSYMPSAFVNSQLKEFVSYLLENKKKRVYIDDGRVYDSHYRRLKRCSLLGGEELNVFREVLLSNCGEVELSGKIPEDDEFYLKEFFGDKIFFSTGYFN